MTSITKNQPVWIIKSVIVCMLLMEESKSDSVITEVDNAGTHTVR